MTNLRLLDNALEQRLINKESTDTANKMPWLQALSEVLVRIRVDHAGNEDSIAKLQDDRTIAHKLRECVFQPVLRLQVMPYLDGRPAGPEGNRKVMWDEKTIYVQGKAPSHYRELVEELCRYFHNSIFKRIIADCVDRDPAWVSEYARENFDLEEVAFEGGTPPQKPDKEGMDSEKPEEQKADVDEKLRGTKLETTEEKAEIGGKEIEENEETFVKQGKKRQQFLKERFAKFIASKGFSTFDDNRYLNKDTGSFLEHSVDGAIQWKEYDGSGRVMAEYWIGHGSLEKGFEIPAETWNLAEISDHAIYIVLVNEDGVNHQYSLEQLLNMSKTGEIELHPAKIIVRIKEKAGKA